MRYAALILFILCAWASAIAEPSEPSTETFRPIITHQMQAMERGDGPSAFEDAAPSLHERFQTPENFMGMVKNGYPMVFAHKGYTFRDAGVDASGRHFQMVEIQADDGAIYDAMYFMEQQSDGSWKISACIISKVNQV